MARGDAARRAGAELAQPVGLDHRDQLRPAGVEEDDDEPRAVGEGRVRLDAGVAQLEVGGRHHGEPAALEPEPEAGPVLDGAAGEAPERPLDGGQRIGRRQERVHVRLGEVERHAYPSPFTKLI